MAGIADGAVIHGAHLAFERSSQCAEAAGGVEGLIGHTIQREFLAFFHGRYRDHAAFHDGFAGLDIFVDQSVGRPGEVIVQRIGRILRQRPYAHAQTVQLVEILCQIVGDDGNEAGGKAALRNERAIGAIGQCLDLPCGGDVFGEVEIMGARHGGGFGNRAGQMEGGGREDRELSGEQSGQSAAVGDIQFGGGEGIVAVEARKLLGAAVGDCDAVVAACGQHQRNGAANLARANDDDLFWGVRAHGKFPSGLIFIALSVRVGDVDS